ncbi:cytochrome c oxidase copper chaperone [Eublepharis macularius]|uniref:Cytochrome c oxidase copper chaperone n=1 Tax=Eublepharis macularius TaxID=481883 RepID=A0AA97KMA3_EUBMA|nr:cytochrome c oxidase copper chaperone [Eublepharis macularius]
MSSLASRDVSGLPAAAPVEQTPPPSLKPCCACPETKQARDTCIIEKGEEHCGPLIEAHKECMRALGFKI